MKKIISIFLVIFGTSFLAQALTTEIGLSYGFQKKRYNSMNSYQTETKSASLSFYFFERMALELGYTDAFYEGEESDSTTSRIVQQSAKIADASLVWVILDKKSLIQPYLKAGAAYIEKDLKIKYPSAGTTNITPPSGWGPSYGAGLKILLSQRFSLRFSYDVWQTPMGDGSKSDDSALKAGLSWIL